MASWHLADISARHVVDEGLVRVSLAVPPAVTASYVLPGQFHRVRARDGVESHFAIASPPGAATFDYLLRLNGGAADALATLPLGASVEVTPAEGPGFPLEQAVGRDLLLVCTGTALAPMRSVLALVATRRDDFHRVTLVQGQRSPRQLPWLDELLALPRVDLHTIVFEAWPGWTGPVGVVQAVVPSVITANTVAFLAGQQAMTDDVTAQLTTAGVPPGRVFLNV